MKRFLVLITLLLLAGQVHSKDLNGTWKGGIVQLGKTMDQAVLLYVEFRINDGILTGISREEIFGTEYYAVKKISGSYVNGELSFNQLVTEKHKSSPKERWCKLSASLRYDTVTGYLKGKYTSSDCKRATGEIILFKESITIPKGDFPETSHIWYSTFVREYKDGLSAPEIRELERKNFVFEPIYFDFDRAEIRPEHEEFLNRLIHVVKGHSDLRVKVTGHTDSDGTDQYNVELSRRRAEAIIDYFVKHGLSADRLEFDFKGEKQPADTNNTPEGRQRNRRVDFAFI